LQLARAETRFIFAPARLREGKRTGFCDFWPMADSITGVLPISCQEAEREPCPVRSGRLCSQSEQIRSQKRAKALRATHGCLNEFDGRAFEEALKTSRRIEDHGWRCSRGDFPANFSSTLP